jgi:hypothetical protein
MLICTSEEAIETFIAHCDVAARDLLLPYVDVVIALSTVLRVRRVLSGVEIDELISELQVRKAVAAERARRTGLNLKLSINIIHNFGYKRACPKGYKFEH